MFIKYVQVPTTSGVKTYVHCDAPNADFSHVEIQADTQAIRYTMDGVTAPASGVGMLLLTTEPPRTFLIEDFKKIKFTQGAGGAGNLNIQYVSGRGI